MLYTNKERNEKWNYNDQGWKKKEKKTQTHTNTHTRIYTHTHRKTHRRKEMSGYVCDKKVTIKELKQENKKETNERKKKERK